MDLNIKMWKSLFTKSNHYQALPYNEYHYIQNIYKIYTEYRIDNNCISLTPLGVDFLSYLSHLINTLKIGKSICIKKKKFKFNKFNIIYENL